MILLTNLTEQTLAPGQSLIFDEVILRSGSCECHRANSTSVKLRATGVYEASYGANIGGPTAATPVQLSLTLGGETLNETTAISVPAAVADRNNVARTTLIKNCCGDFDRVMLTNTGDNSVIVGANSVLLLKRVS